MSELIAIGYGDKYRAEEVRLALLKLQHDHLVDLEDAVVAVRENDGNVKLNQIHHVTRAGIIGGAFWGLLVGLLFMTPLLGAAAGAATGGILTALADVGIDDKFMKELAASLAPGASVLFVLIRRANPDMVVEAIRPYGGRVLRTSLTREDEDELQRTLDASHQTVGTEA